MRSIVNDKKPSPGVPAWFLMIGATLVLLLNGSKPESLQDQQLSRELRQLEGQGFTYHFLDNETVEIINPLMGKKRVKTIAEPDEGEIFAWAQANDIPILEVDPRTIDTTEYLNWYTYWATVPLTNYLEISPLAGDVDHNGRWDFYGMYRDSATSDFETRIYELNSLGQPLLRAQLIPRRGPAFQFLDLDRDNFREVIYKLGDSAFVYEQLHPLGLQLQLRFSYSRWDYPGTAIATNDIVTNLDGDFLDDLIHRGSFPDSTAPNGEFQIATFVAEYDPDIGNFRKVWRTQLRPPPGESGIGGYDVGDYDSDGRTNFLATGAFGEIWVLENAGNDSNVVNWTDTIPFVNMYYNRSGDVDNDGHQEFFISATMSSGNWITVYEADSNDAYSARFMFRLLSGGSLDDPTLLTRDVDGDGKLEFTILSGADLFIFKGDGDDGYKLWYYKLNDAKHSIQFYDFNGDDRLDFIISKEGPSFYTSPYFHSDIFLADQVITGVDDEKDEPVPREMVLFQNYPNPFNPETTIRYRLHRVTDVDLRIYSVSGEEVEVLTHERLEPGTHTVQWSPGPRIGSGIYFVRLRSAGVVYSRKMIYLK